MNNNIMKTQIYYYLKFARLCMAHLFMMKKIQLNSNIMIFFLSMTSEVTFHLKLTFY